jgi:hypothetical protein
MRLLVSWMWVLACLFACLLACLIACLLACLLGLLGWWFAGYLLVFAC